MPLLDDHYRSVLEGFLNYMHIERNFASNTRESYQNDLMRYLLFMQERSRPMAAITAGDIELFLQELFAVGLEATSMARNISAIRSLHRFLITERLLDFNPTENLHQPKLPKHLPNVLSIEEIMRLLEAPLTQTPRSKYALRDKAILEFLYATGVRVSELVNLYQQNLYIEAGFVRIFGKGSKERLVPLGSSAIEWLIRYQTELRLALVKHHSEDYLFLNARGKKLSRMAIFTMVRDYAQEAGIEKLISPHTFRHTFAKIGRAHV